MVEGLNIYFSDSLLRPITFY